MDDFEMLKELKGYCIYCRKRLMLLCGTPRVEIGGCCSGIMSFARKDYIFPVSFHYSCFERFLLTPYKKRRTRFTKKEAITLLRESFTNRLAIEKLTLKEKFCTGDYRRQVFHSIRDTEIWLKRLDTVAAMKELKP